MSEPHMLSWLADHLSQAGLFLPGLIKKFFFGGNTNYVHRYTEGQLTDA
jgi:hypothetical protein